MEINFLISIAGPTAIGKTKLSIQLANFYNTEILSADSRQFFKEMSIGTAAPTAEELAQASHHFIHHKSIKESYSVGDFEREALEKIELLFNKNPVLILVGGSGLYLKSLQEGLDHFPEVAPHIREDLNLIFAEQGIKPLQEQLALLDRVTYEQIDIENPHRVIRALEVSLGTGKQYSSFLNNPKRTRNFQSIKIGLDAPREIIYERINRRVDQMISNGLLEEATTLYPYKHLNALNTVGYKELFTYFEGKLTLEEAVEEIKKNSRRFAKRQLTWFKRDKEIKWFDYITPPGIILDYINTKITT